VLDHVTEDELVREVIHRADGRDQEQEKADAEAQLAQRSGRAPVVAQMTDAPHVRERQSEREERLDQGGHAPQMMTDGCALKLRLAS